MVNTTLMTPEDLLHYQLKVAMTMEEDSLAALEELGGAAGSAEVKKLFGHHADETREQMENLREAFRLMDLKEATAPSPSTKGISKQAESLLDRSDKKLRDQVVVASALGNEHYEMSAYEGLLVPVEAMGLSDVAKLLHANLEQEQHTSDELHALLEKIVG